MASIPQKEAVVIVLDVGKTMSEGPSAALEGGIKAVSLLVQQKVCFLSEICSFHL